jgi:hypothetical protein
MAHGRRASKGDLMSFLDDLASIAKKVVKSPITKIVAGGIAIVAPPIGAGALAGITAADKITDAIDKGKAVVKAVQSGKGFSAAIPGGRLPSQAQVAQLGARFGMAKQAATAAKAVAATAKLAKTDPNAKRAVRLLQVVQKAKAGNPAARAVLHQEVKKQVRHVLSKANDPKATK